MTRPPRPALAGPVLAALWLLLAFAVASSQTPSVDGLRISGSDYYALDDLARALGYSVGEGDGSVTIRTPNGVLTVFDGSPDALWQAAAGGEPERRVAALPVARVDGRWFLPPDLLDALGARLQGDVVLLDDGRRLSVAFPPPAVLYTARSAEVVDLGYGVPGLRFYAAGAQGAETVSLLLVDLGLLPLVFPEQRERLDAFVGGLDQDKPLYVVVTALTPSEWESALQFSQGDRSLEVRYPFRLRLLDGDANRVAPDSPAVGLVLLPDRFNLREPLTVRWGEVSASVTFRR